MHHIKAKSALVVLLMMLWSLLAGCASQTYEELEEEYIITGDRSKLERRERELLRAEEFFLTKAWCLQDEKHVWICPNIRSASRARRPAKRMDIDGTIKQYRIERSNGCGCADQAAMREFMRNLERQLGQ